MRHMLLIPATAIVVACFPPTAFAALVHGFDGECPCCRRTFRQA
jgi:hypothetical protein